MPSLSRIAFALALSASLAATAGLRAQSPVPLLDSVDAAPDVASRAQTLRASRQRLVTVRLAELARLRAAQGGAERRVRLNLFSDVDLDVEIEYAASLRPGALSLRGRVTGRPDSLVLLSTEADVLSAFVQIPGTPTQTYEITHVAGGVHAVRALDDAAFPPEGEPIPVAAAAGDRLARAPGDAADTADLIDVLVVYTPAARIAAGSAAAMSTLIDNALALTNLSYANSGVAQRIRIVHRGETTYTETASMNDGLHALRGTSDGLMDEVHTLRNTYGADLVALLGVYSDACGLAYLMSIESAGFASTAFSVTAWDCAVGNLSFPHELGHNMGLHHDLANAGGGQGAYPYSYGYRDPGFFRTVMAYPCQDPGMLPCPRVSQFSTPDRTYLGRPTGEATTDNALTLNQTALTVANFRQAVLPPPPPPCSFQLTPQSMTLPPAAGTHTVLVTTASSCPWTSASSAPWIVAGAGGLGTAPFTFATTANSGAARTSTVSVGGAFVTVMQADATTVPLSYYLAEGATGFFGLDIALANPNSSAIGVDLSFLKPEGSSLVRRYDLLARSRRTIRVNEIPELADTAVSTVVTSPAGLPVIVERTMTWSAASYGAHTEAAVGGPETAWYFAEGSQGFFDTYVLLANANAAPATVMVNFLTEFDGVVTHPVIVGAASRLTIHAGSIAGGRLIGKVFSITVTSDRPIAAERAMYFGANTFWDGGHESAGVTAAATSWFHAEGATGAYFDTFILVGNPNPLPATVTVRFLLPTGQTITRVKEVAASSRLTINVEAEDPALQDAAVSTTVTSTLPVVSERAMYWPGTAATWFEAHNSFGVTATGTRWGLAEGRAGGTAGYSTYILVANPNATAAAVRVTFFRTNGLVAVKTFTVNPTSRFNIDVRSAAPELADSEFGALVESTNGVGIVVERAMYWNALGVTWAAGTNAAAVRVP